MAYPAYKKCHRPAQLVGGTYKCKTHRCTETDDSVKDTESKGQAQV